MQFPLAAPPLARNPARFAPSELPLLRHAALDAPEPLARTIERFRDLGRRTDIGYAASVTAQWIAIRLIGGFAPRERAATILPSLIAGMATCGIANAEAGRGSNMRGMRSAVTRCGDGHAVSAAKAFFTNGPADHVIFSAANASNPDALDVFLVDGARVSQHDVSAGLSGFRRGHTATMTCDALRIDPVRDRLGVEQHGHHILRECFDFERLLLSAVLTGVLETLLDLSLVHVLEHGLDRYQHVQEKVLRIYAARETADARLGRIGQDDVSGLARHQAALSLLKFDTVDTTVQSAQLCIEAIGSSAIETEHPAQILLRDAMHLKFLGGTRELHKNFLFDQIARKHAGSDRHAR